MLRKLMLLLLLLMFVFMFVFYKSWQWLHLPTIDSDSVYTIERGSSLSQVATDLQRQGVLQYSRLWQWYGRYVGAAADLKAGEYRLSQGLSPAQLLSTFVGGEVVLHQVTLVEGSRSIEAIRLLQKENLLAPLACQALEKCVSTALQLQDYASLEGLLFADTYSFSRGVSVMDVLQMASTRLQSVLTDEWQQRADNLPYESAYEALIMASIIEKETAVPAERAQIAGVFVRRLRKGMRLQTDPTVIYGLGDAYDGNIRSRDLKADNDYNTYRIHGLPPTPIALVGREAIHAALHPAPGKALFFVARGDGSHQFSETLTAHNKAVREYQIHKRRKNYRSTPAAVGKQ